MATHVYTAKILGGYRMQDELCSDCDMPMMKSEKRDAAECVFCPKEEKTETLEVTKGAAKINNMDAVKKEDINTKVKKEETKREESRPGKQVP